MTKIPGFSDFFEISPTLRSHNFFSTEPIFKILGSLESYEYNSFISAILDTQSKRGVPSDVLLWRGFSKMSMHSPIIRWMPHSIPLHCNSEALNHCIMRHELVANRSSLLGIVYSFIIIRYYINYTITYQSVWLLLTREEPLATNSWRILATSGL